MSLKSSNKCFGLMMKRQDIGQASLQRQFKVYNHMTWTDDITSANAIRRTNDDITRNNHDITSINDDITRANGITRTNHKISNENADITRANNYTTRLMMTSKGPIIRSEIKNADIKRANNNTTWLIMASQGPIIRSQVKMMTSLALTITPQG